MKTTKQNKPCTCDANDDSVQSCERHGETTKHTQGPWYSTGVHVQSSVLNEDNYVCEAEGNTPQQAEANARLIAAAPELLEACRVASDSIISEIEGCVSEGCNDTNPCSFCKDANRAFNMLTEAITKATGATL